MSAENILIELAVLAVCIYSGYGFGRPSTNAGTEEILRKMRRTYIWLWFALALSGILIALSIADYTMIFIAVGLLIGFLAGRKSSP